jgi:hypothetical protein
MQALTPAQEAELEEFWIRPGRYDAIRKAYGDLLHELKISSAAFCNLVLVPVSHSDLTWRSLDRLKSPKGEPLRKKYRQLTALLFTCNKLLEPFEKQKLLEPSFANLVQMVNDFAGQQRFRRAQFAPRLQPL